MHPRTRRISRAAPAVGLLAALLLAEPAQAGPVTLAEWVSMPDGTRLETTVMLPDDRESNWPFPTLLIRTPYPYDYEEQFGMATSFGYAVVFQYTRGAGGSEGQPQAFRTDRADGQETLDWLLAQPWCNGSVAMGGASALAIPAYLMAPGADPGLQCQLLAIATGDVYTYTAFNGGVFRQRDVEAWLGWVDAREWLSNLESHRACDEWWAPMRVLPAQAADLHVSAIHFGGWYDVFTQGTIDGYRLYRSSPEAAIRDRQYLVIGPTDHYHAGGRVAGPRTFPPNAGMDLIATTLSFLQWCFDGYNDVIDAWPRVQYYLMGPDEPDAPGNAWQGAEDWPIPADETRLYLAGEGALATAPQEGDARAGVPLDPDHPFPTVGGRNLVDDPGPMDQSGVESREDAVLFTSQPLAEPLTVVGRVWADLRVVPTAEDADVAVRVTDVYPDGRSILITDGIQRVSMRDGCEAPVEVVPGQPVDVSVDLWSTAYVFAKGHRVRVIVTASNSPRFEVNPAWRRRKSGTAFEIVLGGEATALRLPVPRPPEPPAEEAGPADEAEVAEAAPDAVEPELPPADVPAEGIAEDLPATDAGTDDAATDDAGPDAPDLPDAEEDSAPAFDVPDGLPDRDATAGSDAPDAAPEVAADVPVVEAVPSPKGGGGCAAGGSAGSSPALLLGIALSSWFLARRRRPA